VVSEWAGVGGLAAFRSTVALFEAGGKGARGSEQHAVGRTNVLDVDQLAKKKKPPRTTGTMCEMGGSRSWPSPTFRKTTFCSYSSGETRAP